ncbi:MAG TPA: HlyD family efflux transporter periplasmic adaptor subunit [Candidatus Paceibacterota bacterium]|nr:HlyD family efflux transporter periplasmic adaptor subunit [Candidatus Paceibacterota bacterium]
MPENEKKASSGGRGKLITWVIIALIVIGGAGAGLYYYVSSKTVYIDLSQIQAPLINLSPTDSGVLQALYVNPGDTVAANQPVALVGNDVVEAQTAGEIVTTNNNIGQYMNTLTGQGTVATMIDPTQLRVVGNLDENKGLDNVQVGDAATFTVDAFGSEQFKGVVDEVSPTSEQSDVVFNISDERPTNQFAVYVRFDPTQYPQLKNGMSARIWVYTQ